MIGNARAPDGADDGLEIFELLRLLRPVEQHIMPVGRIKVLDGFDVQPVRGGFRLSAREFLKRPELVGIARQPPAGIIAERLIAGLVAAGGAKVVHPMHDQMRAPHCLAKRKCSSSS